MLLALQTALIRCDAYVIDAALQPRQRVLISLAAAAVAIGLMVPLTARFGMVGLCFGLLTGRLVQSVAYPLIAAARCGRPRRSSFRGMLRPASTTAAVFALAATLGNTWRAPGWIALVTLGFATAIVAVVACGGGPDCVAAPHTAASPPADDEERAMSAAARTRVQFRSWRSRGSGRRMPACRACSCV